MRTNELTLSLTALSLLVLACSTEPPTSTGPDVGTRTTVAGSAGPKVIPGRVLARFHPGADRAAVASAHGAQVERSLVLGIWFLKVPRGREVAIATALSRNPHVDFAEPDYIRTFDDPLCPTCTLPDDPFLGYKWDLHNDGTINASNGDELTATGAVDADMDWLEAFDRLGPAFQGQARIAILDTGIRTTHSDLGSKIVAQHDFVNDDTDASDDQGHGTHVAGTAAASGDNATGLSGVAWAPGIGLMAAKVCRPTFFGLNAECPSSAIVSAIVWAVDQGANVVNLSLGGAESSQSEREAMQYARANEVLPFCASGNDNQGTVLYPAAFPECVAVAATNWSDTRASYSNWGPEVELSAPGGDFENSSGYSQIASTCFTGDDDYCLKAGTSMATPQAAGTGALLYAIGLSSAQEVLDRMKSTADDLGPAGPDPEFGSGRINVLAAIEGAGGGDPPPPSNELPVSDFASDCMGLACDFTDQSFDPDGTVVAWSWSFGDGSSSTLQNPSHTFACAGEYPVTLTVTDDVGGTGIGTHIVSVTTSTGGTENGPGAVPGLLMWLQADAIEGLSDGDPVETWTDRSGRCHDANQADTARQPQYRTNQINGRPAVVFDAVDDGMGTSLDPGTEVTVFAVYAGNNTIAGDVFNGGPSRFLLGPRSNRYGLYTGTWILVGSATPGRWVLHTIRQSGSLSEAWIDGQDYGFASTVQDPGIVSLGRVGLGSTALDGAIAELIWYDRPLSDAERVEIETWLMDKYFPPPSVNVPPFADFTSDCTDLQCSFTDQSTDPDGTISTWDWAFGDGETSNDQNPNHNYAQAGTYTVTLTVTDDGGESDARSTDVVVTEPVPGEFTDPSSVPGLALWLRADALTGFAEGDRVALWPDESAWGNDATQATSSKQPTYASDVVNGLPALVFDAVDDGLATTLNPPLETTVFVVYAFDGTGWGDVFSAGPSRFILGSRSRKHAVYTGGWTMHDRITVGRWVVHTVRQSATMAEVWLDGDNRKTTKRVQDPSTIRLADAGTGSNPLNGWIAEVVWYDRPLTDQERADVESWLLTKYAIP